MSVTEVAEWCGVGRSTVGYWVRSGKLPAERVGRDYTIDTQDLLYYLNASGKPVPEWLRGVVHGLPSFAPFRLCWEFRACSEEEADCTVCPVYRKGLRTCFAARRHVVPGREIHCHRCAYYQDHIVPRIGFIHQIDSPVAVYEDLYLWGANSHFSEMTGFSTKELPGLDMERLFHRDSLADVIRNVKRRAMGDPDVPGRYEVFLRNREDGKTRAEICVHRLLEPAGTFLLLFRELDGPEAPSS
jgi:excisionase family DNA binding protein/PAS domain S-box-containing protein